MTTIYLKNFEIEHCLSALTNIMQTQSNQNGINALTMYRLNRLAKDFQEEMEDYSEFKKNLMDSHVEGGSEKPKTENNNFVFKSEEDKQAFMDAMQAYTSIGVRCLLDEGDLREFDCSPYAIQWISILLRSEAITEEPEEMKKARSKPEPVADPEPEPVAMVEKESKNGQSGKREQQTSK